MLRAIEYFELVAEMSIAAANAQEDEGGDADGSGGAYAAYAEEEAAAAEAVGALSDVGTPIESGGSSSSETAAVEPSSVKSKVGLPLSLFPSSLLGVIDDMWCGISLL